MKLTLNRSTRALNTARTVTLGALVAGAALLASCGGGSQVQTFNAARVERMAARERMMAGGVLAKDTHGQTVRFAPPIVISQPDLHHAIDVFESALRP